MTPDGRRIVSQDILATTRKPQTPLPSTPDVTASYCMGWLDATYKGVQYFWHTGGLDGFKTDMTMVPNGNIGILLFANTETGEYLNKAVRGRIIERLFCLDQTAVDTQKKLYDAEKQSIQKLKDSVTAYSVPPSEVKPILGFYKKKWLVEYVSGLPMLSRPDGTRLVLLPTTQGYCIASGTEADGFKNLVKFVPEAGIMHLVITDRAGNVVDDLPRLRSGETVEDAG